MLEASNVRFIRTNRVWIFFSICVPHSVVKWWHSENGCPGIKKLEFRHEILSNMMKSTPYLNVTSMSVFEVWIEHSRHLSIAVWCNWKCLGLGIRRPEISGSVPSPINHEVKVHCEILWMDNCSLSWLVIIYYITTCVTLDRSLNVPGTQFPYQWGDWTRWSLRSMTALNLWSYNPLHNIFTWCLSVQSRFVIVPFKQEGWLL